MDELELCLLATYDFWDDPLHIKKVQSFAICGDDSPSIPNKKHPAESGRVLSRRMRNIDKGGVYH